jgi:hypothetical protein
LGTAFHGSLGGIGPYPIEVNQCPISHLRVKQSSALVLPILLKIPHYRATH